MEPVPVVDLVAEAGTVIAILPDSTGRSKAEIEKITVKKMAILVEVNPYAVKAQTTESGKLWKRAVDLCRQNHVPFVSDGSVTETDLEKATKERDKKAAHSLQELVSNHIKQFKTKYPSYHPTGTEEEPMAEKWKLVYQLMKYKEDPNKLTKTITDPALSDGLPSTSAPSSTPGNAGVQNTSLVDLTEGDDGRAAKMPKRRKDSPPAAEFTKRNRQQDSQQILVTILKSMDDATAVEKTRIDSEKEDRILQEKMRKEEEERKESFKREEAEKDRKMQLEMVKLAVAGLKDFFGNNPR